MALPPGLVPGAGSYGPVSDSAGGARAEPYGTPDDMHGFRMKAAPTAPPATLSDPCAALAQYEQPPATAEDPTKAVVPPAAPALTSADIMAQLQGLTAGTAPAAPEAAAAAAAAATVPGASALGMQQYALAALMPGMGGQYVLAPAASAYYPQAAATAAPANAALQQYIAAAYPTLDATSQAALVQYYSQLQAASAQVAGQGQLGAGGLATVISGGYPAVVATTGPSNAWITNRLIEREKARIEKKYDEADKLRKLLRTNGIEVDDRDRSWTSRDGRRGPRPNHNDPMEEENEAATLASAVAMPGLLGGLGGAVSPET